MQEPVTSCRGFLHLKSEAEFDLQRFFLLINNTCALQLTFCSTMDVLDSNRYEVLMKCVLLPRYNEMYTITGYMPRKSNNYNIKLKLILYILETRVQ